MTQLLQALGKRLMEDYGITATAVKSIKNNGVVLDGLSLRRKDERIAPVFYLNRFFDAYKRGELTVNDILNRIVVEYEKLPTPPLEDIEKMLSAPDFIDRISLRMLNAERNEAMIEERNLLYHEIEDTDLVALFYVNVLSTDDSSASIALTEDLMKKYLPKYSDGDDLFKAIVQKDPGIKFEHISVILEKMMQRIPTFPPAFPEVSYPLYVLTNTNMTNGAGVILYDAAKKAIKERFTNGNVTVIPSSVHELILLETSENEDLDALREMVSTVNRTEVTREDFLSDNVYHYDIKTGELTIA